MSMSLKERLPAGKAKSEEREDVTVAGWVANVKTLGQIAFVTLRDRSGTIQLTLKEEDMIEEVEDLTNESVVAARGDVVEGEKEGEKELVVGEWEVLSQAETPLPVDIWGNTPTGLAKRLDHRYLDLRKDEIAAIFEVRSTVNQVIRETLLDRGFIEMQTPKLAGAGAEGGAELFDLEYYDREAYLSQSQQLYKQMMMASGFERVFEIGPSFRAEKSRTKRHLTEFTHFDFEMAYIDSEEDVLEMLEDIFTEVMERVKSDCGEACSILDASVVVPEKPFPRVTYEEAVEMIQGAGMDVEFGEDIGTSEEHKLGELMEEEHGSEAYFITEWPYETKPFYIMKGEEATRGFDFDYLGEEVASGGQREHRYDVLTSQIREKGLDPEDFDFYLQPFRYGMPPHGGFGLGIDRLVRLILDLDNVKEATLFPRTPDRLVP